MQIWRNPPLSSDCRSILGIFSTLPKPDNHVDNEYYLRRLLAIVMSNYGFRQARTEDEDRLILELYHRHLLTQIMKQMRNLDMHHTTLVHTDIGVDNIIVLWNRFEVSSVN